MNLFTLIKIDQIHMNSTYHFWIHIDVFGPIYMALRTKKNYAKRFSNKNAPSEYSQFKMN